MRYETKLSRRCCLALAGIGLTGCLVGAKAGAEEDPRNAHEQFHRNSVDQDLATFVTRTGHYEFLVVLVNNPGTADSALIGRRPVRRDEGILYANDSVRPISLSNQGVPFPTDLLFVSRDGRVVEVHPSIMANDSRAITSMIPVKAAFQFIAGTTARISAMPGDYVLNPLFGRTL
jgi:uncharacterized membrane protein (UPF0127 family)